MEHCPAVEHSIHIYILGLGEVFSLVHSESIFLYFPFYISLILSLLLLYLEIQLTS
jgi:hypothetical protein